MISFAHERVLVIAAHPDDETLGLGASLARWSREGVDLCVGMLGEGPTSRIGVAGMPQSTVEEAAGILGVKRLLRHTFVDQRFDEAGQLTVNHVVEEWVRLLAPTVVISHDETDLNLDHLMVSRAARTVSRPHWGVKAILSFEVACSSEWALGERFRPNVFVEVTREDMRSKTSALAKYDELRDGIVHPQSRDKIYAAAEHLGAIAGCEYAEGFRLLRLTELGRIPS